jgi:hypothetical protein
MKHIKLFESFINEQEDSKQVQTIRKKLEGKPGAKTLIGMYKFYWEKEHQEYKGLELLKKLAYYDQAIRDEKNFDIAQSVGIQMQQIDKFNQELSKPFMGKVKAGTEEFSDLWIIIQHADNQPKLQQAFLEVYGEAMKKTNPGNLAYMIDRVAVNTGEAQTTLSQGMDVTYKGKTGWLPRQMKGIKLEGQPVDAEDPDTGEKIQLVRWAASEESKINTAIKVQLGPKNVEKAEAAGIKINLASYVEHVMGTDFVGNWMIKK